MNWTVLYFILYLLAAVCFFLATVGWAPGSPDARPRFAPNFLALGLLFLVAVPLIDAGRALD